MSSNLANVYANLLRKYGENYMITYAVAPTYLNNIVGAAENLGKIILFYVEVFVFKIFLFVIVYFCNYSKIYIFFK